MQTPISEKNNLGWSETSASVIYVELRGEEEQYGALYDDSFSKSVQNLVVFFINVVILFFLFIVCFILLKNSSSIVLL